MEKPTTVILSDCEISFKEVCVMFEAKFAWLDGEKYRLPIEKWVAEISCKSA